MASASTGSLTEPHPAEEKRRQPLARPFIVRPWPLIISGLLFCAGLALYGRTLAPSVATLFDDSLEFQLVAYQLGIAHPTGYPLYTLLGKLFTLLPLGDVAYRVNLMSAVFGALTTAVIYLLIGQIMQGRRNYSAPARPLLSLFKAAPPAWSIHGGAVTGASLLAISPVFWGQATIAEVYTLNAFFVATLLLLAVIPCPNHRANRRLVGLAFLTGLALTHHRTILLLLPALALYLYLTHPPARFNGQTLALAGLLGLAPLLLYLYLPLRGHIGSLDGAYQNTWAGFWEQVSGGGYGAFIFDNPFRHDRDPLFYWNLFTGQFYTIILGCGGLLGLLVSKRYKILLLTGLAFATYGGFNLFYQVTDIDVFFIPVFLIWAVWSGIGLIFLVQLLSTLKDKRRRLPLTGLLAAWLVFGLGSDFQKNWTAMTDRYTWGVHDYGLDILQQPLPAPPAGRPVIVGILGEMTLIRYFQHTENRRPDLETVAADLEAERLAVVERALQAGQIVYLTRPLPGAAERWSLGAVGPLIRINPQPVASAPDFSIPREQIATDSIDLLGYDVSRPPHTGEGPAPVRLTLFWQATEPLPADLKVSARLLDTAGASLAVVDAVPVHFAYPTTAWRQGEIIRDVYDLTLPAETPAGSYTPLIIWYDPARNAAEVGRIELEPIIVE